MHAVKAVAVAVLALPNSRRRAAARGGAPPDRRRRSRPVHLLRRGAARDPDHRLHYEVAVAAYQIGDTVRLQLRAAIRLAPTYSDGHFELANALQTDGRAAETEHPLREAARFAQPGSDVAMIYNNLGNVLVDVGDQRAALAAYESGRRIAPTHRDVLNGRRNQYTDTGGPTRRCAPSAARRATRRARTRVVQHGQRAAQAEARRRGISRLPPRAALVARRSQLPAGPRRNRPRAAPHPRGDQLVSRRPREPRRRARAERAAVPRSRGGDARGLPAAGSRGDGAPLALARSYRQGHAATQGRARREWQVRGEWARRRDRGAARCGQERGGATAAALDAIAAAKQRRRRRKKGGAARGGPGGGRRLAIFCRKVYSGEKADGTWEWGRAPRSAASAAPRAR